MLGRCVAEAGLGRNERNVLSATKLTANPQSNSDAVGLREFHALSRELAAFVVAFPETNGWQDVLRAAIVLGGVDSDVVLLPLWARNTNRLLVAVLLKDNPSHNPPNVL